jgi:hypothetical protein
MRRLLLLTLIAACDPVVAHTPDAGADATPDAPTHGMVRVQIYDPHPTGAVVTGVPVVFIEADGTQVGHPTTDSQGYASADVHAGASATVVITTQGSTQMTTLLGLKPGDDIILGPRRGTPTDAGTFTVSWPSYGGGVGQYYVYGPCGGTNTGPSALQATLSMKSDCKQDTMDLLLIAEDSNGNPLGYLTKTGVAFAAGGSTALTGSYDSVSSFTASYTNIPPNVTSIDYSRNMPDGYGFSRGSSGSPMSGTFSTSVPAPQGSKAQVTTDINNSASGAEQTFVFGIQGNALTYGMDVGATALPWLGKPMLDAANHRITVSVDPTGTSNDKPDAFFAQTSYSRTVNGTAQSFAWLLLSATPGDVTMPTLPPEVGDVMPKADDTVGFTAAAMVESDAIDGYDTIRQDIYLTVLSVTDPIHPTAGKTRESINFGN